MPPIRIPPIHCLQAFEALSRLRSVTLAAEELHVTPSAVSHRMRQLETLLGTRLFGRSDFSPSADGQAYLEAVRRRATRTPFAAPGRRLNWCCRWPSRCWT